VSTSGTSPEIEEHQMDFMRSSRAVLAAVLVAACAAGCGSSNSDTPAKVVERFTAAYAAKDYATACREMSDYTDIANLGKELLTAGAQSNHLDDVDLDHGCAGILKSAAQADPNYVRALADQKVENIDAGPKRATVQTDAASWDVYKFGGHWKLASLDALIPQ
jgi:hypothetical protein